MRPEIKLVIKENLWLKLSNEEKYSLCIKMYKDVGCSQKFSLMHHIKPKHLFPELANAPENIVRVPDVVHFLLYRMMPVESWTVCEEDKIIKAINKSVSKSNPNMCLDFTLAEFMLFYLDQIMKQYLKCKKRYLGCLSVSKCFEPEIDDDLKARIQFIHDDFVNLFAIDVRNELVASDIDIVDI